MNCQPDASTAPPVTDQAPGPSADRPRKPRKPKVSDAVLVSAIVSGKPIKEVAAAIGCAPYSVRRRLREPRVAALLARAERELVGDANRMLLARLATAIDRVVQIMTDPTTPPAVALRAASTIIDGAIKTMELCEQMDQRARLDRLARKAAGPGHDPVQESEAALLRAGIGGDWRAALAYLAAKDPEHWGRFAGQPDQAEDDATGEALLAIVQRMGRRVELAALPPPAPTGEATS